MVCICFPGETTVTTKQGGKRIQELTIGEEILTSSRHHPTPKWTKFYTWGHREASASAEYVVLSTTHGKTLKISSAHLLFVAGDEGSKVVKTAGQVVKGDKLFHLGETASMELLTVVEISSEILAGVYAPFTMSGHFLANGFLVGCYAHVGDFEVAHAALAPLRTWYRIRASPTKGDVHLDGIHGYARKLMKIRESLPVRAKNWVNNPML